MSELFNNKITFGTIADLDELRTSYLLPEGTLICAPRRSGKTTALVHLVNTGWKPTIVMPNVGMLKLIQDETERCVLASNCKNVEGYLCVDEMDCITSKPNLVTEIPWSQVLCATTSTLDFDRIQAACFNKGFYPEYDWIKHVLVVLPRSKYDR